ncbi:MAG: von Willebrand factor type A domain-containing protein, partial [Phycisphaerales bacterium]|nr:von Willebrand factor type A domain-containing protein [Phycisphaerales bacterium]
MRQGAPRDADSEVGQESFGRDRFIREAPSNPFKSAVGQEDSTFSIDVDTASYANLRRMLLAGQWPRPDQVHIEEMLNYFSYSDPAPAPDAEHPVAAHVELATCPWAPDHRLARITLKAREIDMANRVGSNLVFLIDVSGSMAPADRLPLIKESLTLLVNTLTEDDRIAIVTYAGDTRVALPPTYANRKPEILDVIDSLRTGGGTNGASGLQLAYDTAAAGFIEGGINRVILATDGDFNVGVSS